MARKMMARQRSTNRPRGEEGDRREEGTGPQRGSVEFLASRLPRESRTMDALLELTRGTVTHRCLVEALRCSRRVEPRRG